MNENQATRYTHIVKRESGYLAGWFRSETEALGFAVECNREVPGDPAHAEELEGDEVWEELLAEFAAEEEYDHSRAKEDARNAWQHEDVTAPCGASGRM